MPVFPQLILFLDAKINIPNDAFQSERLLRPGGEGWVHGAEQA